MKTLQIITTTGIEQEVELTFRKSFSGHGHYKIFCAVSFDDHKKEFVKTTDNMPWVDSLSEYEYENNPSLDEIDEFYFEQFGDYFEMEYINDWVEDIKFVD